VRDNLSQCQLNRGAREHFKFEALIAEQLDPSKQLIWAPERTKSAWHSLTGLTWEGELDDPLRGSLAKDIPAAHPITPWIRSASDTLSRPMTILYALEKLNDDDGWTRKETLTIHVSAHPRRCDAFILSRNRSSL
jgi:splicing suppressor protein 51